MPFTFAHPAIVLPLTKLPKRWFSSSGLIIGSIAPDFEYFLRGETISNHSHTIAGLFYFNLPVSLLIAFIFHRFIRNSLIDHLPSGFYERFYSYRSIPWFHYARKNSVALVLSILIGGLSHIFLDSFTHQDGFFVQLLQLQITSLYSFPVYRIFQHVGTLIGFAFIGWFIWSLKPGEVKKRPPISIPVYWLKVCLFSLGFLGFKFLLDHPLQLGEIVVSLINGGMLGILSASLTSKKHKKHLHQNTYQ